MSVTDHSASSGPCVREGPRVDSAGEQRSGVQRESSLTTEDLLWHQHDELDRLPGGLACGRSLGHRECPGSTAEGQWMER